MSIFGQRSSVMFDKIYKRLSSDQSLSQTAQQILSDSGHLSPKKQEKPQSNERKSIMQNLSLDEKIRLRKSFFNISNNFKRSKLNSIVQSERLDYDNEEDLQLLIESIQNNQRTLLEGKLILQAFSSTDLFKNKQIFQMNENLMIRLDEYIKIHRFKKFQSILSHSNKLIQLISTYFFYSQQKTINQQLILFQPIDEISDRFFIILQGELAALRIPIKKKTTLQTTKSKSNSLLYILIFFYNQMKLKGDIISCVDVLSDQKAQEQLKGTQRHIEIFPEVIPSTNNIIDNKLESTEYRLLKEFIENLTQKNQEILKKNYPNTSAKKEAIGKYIAKNELLQQLQFNLDRMKPDETISKMNFIDQDFLLEKYPNHELTKIFKKKDYFGEQNLIYENQWYKFTSITFIQQIIFKIIIKHKALNYTSLLHRLDDRVYFYDKDSFIQYLQRLKKINNLLFRNNLNRNGELVSLSEDTIIISFNKEGMENMIQSHYQKLIISRLQFLKQYKFIEPMMEKDILNIIPEIEEINYRKNNTLYKEGDKTDTIYLLYSGDLELQQYYSIDDLNELVNEQRNKMREEANDKKAKQRVHEDISNNKGFNFKLYDHSSKLKTLNQGILNQKTNKDKTNMNKLSVAKDNFRNMRLVTLYQFTSGSFFGDKEYFEEDSIRKTRTVVVSHEAIVFQIKIKDLGNHLRMNKTYELMKKESQKKNEFYFKRIIDYTVLNQNIGRKKSSNTSELMDIIANRKVANRLFEREEKKNDIFNTQGNIIEEQITSQSKLQSERYINIEKTDQIKQQHQIQEVVQVISKQNGDRRGKSSNVIIQEQFQEFDGLDQLNKQLVKKMNIIKQGNSIFDQSIPNDLKDQIILKIKQLRHLTPASVNGVIQKVMNQSKQKTFSDLYGKKNQPEKQPTDSQTKSPIIKVGNPFDLDSSFNQIQEYILSEKRKEKQGLKRKDSQNASSSFILNNRPESSKSRKNFISQEKKQTYQEEIISKFSENPLDKMQQSYLIGKKNFQQIFLQSLADSDEKQRQLIRLKKGYKIENLMKKKREQDFQEYMNDELENNRIKSLKRKQQTTNLLQSYIGTENSIKQGSQSQIENSHESIKYEINDLSKLIMDDENKNLLNPRKERIRSAMDIRRSDSAQINQMDISACNTSTSQFMKNENKPLQRQSSLFIARSTSPNTNANNNNNFLSKFHKLSSKNSQAPKKLFFEAPKSKQKSQKVSILDKSDKSNEVSQILQRSSSIIATQLSDQTTPINLQFPDSKLSSINNEQQINGKIEQGSPTTQMNTKNTTNDLRVTNIITDNQYIPQTKKQILLNSQQSPLNTNYDLIQQINVQSMRQRRNFSEYNYFEQKRVQTADQCTDTIQIDQKFQIQKKQPQQLLINVGLYKDQIAQNNFFNKKNDELEKISSLLQRNKRFDSNSCIRTQEGNRSPQSWLKQDSINQNSFTQNQRRLKNNSSVFSEQPGSPISLFNSQNIKLSSSQSSWTRDLKTYTIPDSLSPRTNPITYQQLSTQINQMSHSNLIKPQNSSKERNIHKLSLERIKQKQINTPICMRKKTNSQNFVNTFQQ